jgi:hypothetical protein
MKKLIILLATLLVPLIAVPSFAAQIRVFVADINATGIQNGNEMKVTLQTLLSSRLNSDKVAVVGNVAEADAVVSGTYVSFGKVFSIDTIAKNPAGKTVARAFVQGETQDELIPAVGKLADKLSAELGKIYSSGQVPAATASPALLAQAPLSAPKSDIVKNEQQVRPVPAGEFIKPREQEQGNTGGWISKRLDGAANLMAVGKSLPDGGREIFLAEERRISCYHQGKDMKLVAATELPAAEKILSLDTIEGSDGTLDIYVTILRSEEPASEVWQLKGDKLVRVAEKMPYFFRVVSLSGGTKKLYVQAMGRETDFYGEVSEATRNGSNIILKNPIKMPRYADIYSFNQFRDSDGKIFTTVINPDGYLIVYDQDLKELWRSNDRFGGSELYFMKEDNTPTRLTGEKYRWTFMNQRIQVSSRNEILVGKNDGFWIMGNARSYKRGAVYCFVWNGSSLEEKWRTRDTQNYMPDYLFDETHNELLILQTVQRSGITTRGASSLSIKKVE